MHIHDAHRLALLIVGRRVEKREPEPRAHDKKAQPPKRREKTRRQRHEARRIGIGVKPLRGGNPVHVRHLARGPR